MLRFILSIPYLFALSLFSDQVMLLNIYNRCPIQIPCILKTSRRKIPPRPIMRHKRPLQQTTAQVFIPLSMTESRSVRWRPFVDGRISYTKACTMDNGILRPKQTRIAKPLRRRFNLQC